MTTIEVTTIAGVILSLLFSYFPGLSAWFATLVPDKRRLIMLAALLITVAGAYALSCAGQGSYFTCDSTGAWGALRAFIAAMIANQATYQITPQSSQVKSLS